MKVVAIVQARMGSTRLPGKILQDLAGKPVLARVLNRLSRSKRIHEVMVATTVEPADEAIVRWCAANGWRSFRGSESDVLDRYYQAAKQAQADIVVRITSDCPLIDPVVVDRVVEALSGADYACDFLPERTFPRGLDAEVFTFAALERAQIEDKNPASREHVTAYFYSHTDTFQRHVLTNPVNYSAHRWTVDTPEDLELIRRIYGEFADDTFSWEEALAVVERHPDWPEINRHIEQKKL